MWRICHATATYGELVKPGTGNGRMGNGNWKHNKLCSTRVSRISAAVVLPLPTYWLHTHWHWLSWIFTPTKRHAQQSSACIQFTGYSIILQSKTETTMGQSQPQKQTYWANCFGHGTLLSQSLWPTVASKAVYTTCGPSNVIIKNSKWTHNELWMYHSLV